MRVFHFVLIIITPPSSSLAALCRQSIPNCIIYIIKNDDFTIQRLLPHLDLFSAIVVGPGPGSPDNAQDIGIVKDLWKIREEHILPIFGVCLGLQSLCIEFGARLQQLQIVKHGQVSSIRHNGTELFQGVGRVQAVRYHSLHVQLAADGEIEQLAWADDEEENGHVVMAAKHRTKPFWAVQYHPESVCTEGGGKEVVANFWRLSQSWVTKNGRRIQSWHTAAQQIFGHSWPHFEPHLTPPSALDSSLVITATVDLPGLPIATLCELLGASNESSPFVLLESAAQPGRFSIIGSVSPNSLRITHHVSQSFVSLIKGESAIDESLGSSDIWSWLAAFMRSKKAQGGCPEIPFWGGLVGQLSYELGVHSLHVPLRNGQADVGERHPDVNLIFVERSVILDSVTGKVYIQSLIPHDESWIAETVTRLRAALHHTGSHRDWTHRKKRTSSSSPPVVTLPDKAHYISRINQAKEHLYAGDSYELCLTAHTHISIPAATSASSSSWERYKSLRQSNPAPYSAYLRLHPTTLLSSSPERFLSYSRPPGTICQLRPIKGTVRKAPGITRAVAEQALSGSKKEVAENLMIVDLIRHDLHGVVGEDVEVKQFCSVEEYKTVWQLVSVIEGKYPSDTSAAFDPDGELGWEVLKNSLPPGASIFNTLGLPPDFYHEN